MLNQLIQWDKELFLLLNGAGVESYDAMWVFITKTKSAIPLFIFIIYLLVKKHGKKFWQGLILILIAVSLADLSSVHCFKNVFMRLRPSHEPELADQIRLLVSKGGLYGFVSSHAANFFAIAGIVSALFSEKKHIPYLLYTWAAVVAYSRIYVGKHYFLDIAGGALLGIFIAKLLWFTALKLKEKYKLAL